MLWTTSSPTPRPETSVTPSAVEKAGTFENIHNRLQAFEQAIAPIEFARSEGQIALDLLAAAGAAEPMRYDAVQVRSEMGSPFASDVHVPSFKDTRQPEVEFVEL